LAFVGLLYLGVFIVLRAADSLPILNDINQRYYESVHLALELPGVLMIGVSAARAVYRETARFKASVPAASPYKQLIEPAI
jgi:hypothetical protein